jgi:hypothetical protein
MVLVVLVPMPRQAARSGSGTSVSERAGQGEARLLGGALGSAGQPAVQGQLVSTSQVVRLSQALGHLCAGQVFMHELHLVAPVLVSVHGMCGSVSS